MSATRLPRALPALLAAALLLATASASDAVSERAAAADTHHPNAAGSWAVG